MRKIAVLLFFSMAVSAIGQVSFDDYFLPKTLRFDYNRAGNSDTSIIYFEQLLEEQFWGGSKTNLIDKFNYGDYLLQVFDSTGKTMIYSRGYSSLFREWIDTEEAKTLPRSYYGSVVMPFPKNKIIIKLLNRNRKQVFNLVYELEVDPKNYFIVKEVANKYETEKIGDADPAFALDIAVLPEGYTQEEMQKFQADVKRFIGYFFKVSPFKEYQPKINFWLVNAPSEESGTDIPGQGIWKKTILNTHFYTFNSERYLTTRDVRQIRDLAAHVPYDQIYILVNSSKYGGGGIYNYYNLCTSDNQYSEEVFTHEFGHAFAALGDEYQYGYDNAEELYDMSVEPWQVNISNLVNFDSKWKDLVEEGTPIPTLDEEKYKTKIGAFEGAGYVKKGIYRPVYDCKMRSNATKTFCPVCFRAVVDLLKFYTE
ncbi:MAG: M64 family metallopeptidase [Bacteroidales bacterium]|nr:M64 family metallopeptidase [Bacteroidales bacterium]